MKKLYTFFAVLIFSGSILSGCQTAGSYIGQNSDDSNNPKEKCSYLTIAEANEILGFDLEKSKAPTADLESTPCHYYDKKDIQQEKRGFYGVQFYVINPPMDAKKYYNEVVASNKKTLTDYIIKDISTIGKGASYYYEKSPMITVGNYPNSSHLDLWTYDKNSIINIRIDSLENDTEENLLEKAKKISEKILGRI